MGAFIQYMPPNISEIIAPPEFAQDEDLQERIIDDKMLRQWVVVMFICSLLLSVVVMV